jgi:hypothetical protein
MEQTEGGAWLTLRLHAKSPDAAFKIMQKFARIEKLNCFKANTPRVWDLQTDSRTQPVWVGTATINPGEPE